MHKPTEEQIAAIDCAMTDEDVKIFALAGCGKTTSLEMISNHKKEHNQSGVYVSFSKSIVNDAAGRFPSNVTCSTAHSLAYKAVGHKFKNRLNGERQRYNDVADMIGIEESAEGEIEGTRVTFSRTDLVHLVKEAVNRFCQGGDREIGVHHVPVPELFQPWSRQFRNVFGELIVIYANEMWSDLNSHCGRLNFTHNNYLKIWQLTDPKISAEFVLFDECQDANGVMLAIVQNQTHAQKIWVGDSYQQIYSWNGAVNALGKIETPHQCYLSESWRFGQGVADVANIILDRLGSPKQLKGNGPESKIGPNRNPKCRLFRTNGACLSAMFAAYDAGISFHLIGNTDEIQSFVSAADRMQKRQRPNHPELNPFDSWNDVLAFVGTAECGDGAFPRLVSQIEQMGTRKIISICRAAEPNEQDADQVISTAHKSKGREWESVSIGGDFPESTSDEELRLLYVAATRGKCGLDISAVYDLFFPGDENEESDFE